MEIKGLAHGREKDEWIIGSNRGKCA